MLYINQLFHLEDVIRSKYSSFDAIKKARLEKEKPVVEGFLSWLDQQNPTSGSRMDKAVEYYGTAQEYSAIYQNLLIYFISVVYYIYSLA